MNYIINGKTLMLNTDGKDITGINKVQFYNNKGECEGEFCPTWEKIYLENVIKNMKKENGGDN